VQFLSCKIQPRNTISTGTRKCGKVQVQETLKERFAKKESPNTKIFNKKKNGKESSTAFINKMTTKMAINAKVCNQKF